MLSARSLLVKRMIWELVGFCCRAFHIQPLLKKLWMTLLLVLKLALVATLASLKLADVPVTLLRWLSLNSLITTTINLRLQKLLAKSKKGKESDEKSAKAKTESKAKTKAPERVRQGAVVAKKKMAAKRQQKKSRAASRV